MDLSKSAFTIYVDGVKDKACFYEVAQRGIAMPGGHIEPGESIIDAVVREMKEETGLTILNPKLCVVKQFPIENGRYIVFLFTASEFEGELISSDEGEMHWKLRQSLGW